MEQQKALNALAPFLALAKSASSPRQAADLVIQATSAQNTYVFAELLETPAMQSLRQDSQYSSHYTLLEIFTWGTVSDYQASANTLPALSPTQTQKLQLLSLITIAASGASLTYPSLLTALSLPTQQALEALITNAIYADLVRATLDPAAQRVIISSVAPLRDVAPGSIANMLAALQAWTARCEATFSELEGRMAEVKDDALVRAKMEARAEQQQLRAHTRWEQESKLEGLSTTMDLDHVDRALSGRPRGLRSMFGKKR